MPEATCNYCLRNLPKKELTTTINSFYGEIYTWSECPQCQAFTNRYGRLFIALDNIYTRETTLEYIEALRHSTQREDPAFLRQCVLFKRQWTNQKTGEIYPPMKASVQQ